MDHRNDGYSFDALDDIDIKVEVLQKVPAAGGSDILKLDQETSWLLEDVMARAKARDETQGRPFDAEMLLRADLRRCHCKGFS